MAFTNESMKHWAEKKGETSSPSAASFTNASMQRWAANKAKESKPVEVKQTKLVSMPSKVVTAPAIGAATPARQTSAGNVVTLPVLDDIKQDITQTVKGAAANQELGQFGAGNIDLYNRPKAINADGTTSTVHSTGFNVDGKEVLVPTVWMKDGKAYHSDNLEEILQHYYDTGEYLGKFDTVDDANEYAEKLHLAQDYYYRDRGTTSGAGQQATGERTSTGAGRKAGKSATAFDVAKNAVDTGLNQFNSGLAKTLDFILPTEFLGEHDPVSKLNDYYSGKYERAQQELERSTADKGKAAQVAGQVAAGTAAAVPNAILALMSGGTSAAAQGTTAGLEAASAAANSGGLLSTIGSTAQQLVKNPMYWSSVSQTLGTDYEDAKADGASETEAIASAFISSLLNAGVEVGGGIETLPAQLQNGSKSAVREWVKSALDEGKEEVVQDIISGLTQKAIYDHDKKYVSAEDNSAVINPYVLGQDFAMGAAVGGILGGAQTGINSALNAAARNRITPMPGSGLEGAATVDQGRFTPPTMEQVNTDTAAQESAVEGVPGQNKTASMRETESTAVNTDPAKHTAVEQAVIEAYQGSTSDNLLSFYNEMRSKGTQDEAKGKFGLKDVSARMASDVYDLTGKNIKGFKTDLDGRQAWHISNDHGENGKADHSMADPNDVSRMQYVLDNYDSISKGGTTDAYWEPNPNYPAKQKRAETVVFSKKVNGTYYVVEAVPITKSKSVKIVSAYMLKDGKTAPGRGGQKNAGKLSQPPDANAPWFTSENDSASSSPASDPTILKNEPGVNRNSAQNSDITPIPGSPEDRARQGGNKAKRFAMSADGLVDEVVSGDYGENTVGSAQARFPYQEAPSQSVADNLFTEQEMQDHDLKSRHQVFTNAHGRADADMLLDYDYEGEVERLKTDEWGPVENVEGHKILENLVEQARKSNTKEAWDKVKEWKKLYDQKGGTEAGQTLQSRAQFANSAATLTAEAADFLDSDKAKKMPEQKKQQIRDSVATQSEALENIPEGDTAGLIDLIKRSSEIRRTTGLFSKKTSKQMDWVLNYIADNVSDGEAFLRGVAADQIRSIPLDYSKTSFTEKAKSLRVQFMLSKISTVMRNLVSNGIFDPLESLANNTGIVADLLMSKATGQRTTAFEKSWASKAKRHGSLEGALKSFVEVGLDADSAGSKYEGTGGRTFKMTGNPFERFLSTWAKFQNYTLTTTDEFQKGGIRAEAQENIDKLKRSGKLDADSLSEWADETAKQRTFQNDSIPANMMVQARDTLNAAHLGDIGLGDILVPFARVPGNLAAQAANYSPIGMINGLRQTVEVMVDSKNGNYSAEKQAQAARNFGRGLTGTGLLAWFTALALKGVIDVAGDDDEDKEALERAQGRTGTQWNLSATLRLLNGGDPAWRDGDMLMSIGFLDPINSIMAAGALLADEYREDGSISAGDVMKASLGSIWQSVLDLPAMSSINDLMTTYEYAEGDTTSDKLTNTILDYGGGELESFVVPNFMRGIATGLDDTVRNRYGGESIKETAADGIKSGLPGLRETLPASLDPFGREKTQTGNTALNILNNNLLPGALTRYKETEVESTLNRVYEATENAAVYPDKKAPNSISVDNQKIQLDQEQKDEFMTTAGAAALEIMMDLIDSENFQKMNEETQGQYLAVANEYARAMAKAEVTDGKYELTGTNKKIAAAEDAGMPAADYIMYKLNSAAYNEDGENALTIGENAKAIQNSGMSEKEQTMYWLVTYPEWSEKADEKGVDIEDYINYKVYSYDVEGDKNANGDTIEDSKKKNVINALVNAGYSWSEAHALYRAVNAK